MQNFKEYSSKFFNPQKCKCCKQKFKELAINEELESLCENCFEETEKQFESDFGYFR
ncbi:uncharacterized protein METZ01_LOCUS78246 [marine metagenome]|uniref:Uncharacterized protein n=1 Tax=marine metagenome TaxID=408172 RepID=A0A381UAZ0_9ZZZZ|tara:strand:- start:204 stop:374 length:171 start_codon:yes stop_codon:yes gene_type:complete